MAHQKLKIIFFGDSITQAGVQPGGYILKIADLVLKAGLKDKFDLTGAGIGGNKIYDLYLRCEEDVLSLNPDVVFIYVGVNDVWHKLTHGTGTDLDKFEKFYTALIGKLGTRGIRVVLVTPAVIGERNNFTNELDTDLNRYTQVVRKLAKQYSLSLVDLRNAFAGYNLKNNPENKESGILTTDRVHLTERGNQLVADEIWKVLTKFN
jgi:lysophospholipase L1-like esterase